MFANFRRKKGSNNRYVPFVTLSRITLLVFSCSCLPVIALVVDPGLVFPSLPKPSALPTATEYILGESDRIQINVFAVEELSGEYLVLIDGTVSFPWIGRVKLAGLTVTEASQRLSQAYGAFLKRPIVTVSVITPRPLKIAIAGEVNTPGSYNIPLEEGQRSPSITDLITKAGGITTTADISQVELHRSVQGREQTFRIDLWHLLDRGNLDRDISLQDGDRIFIPTKVSIDPRETRLLSNASFGIQTNQEVDVVVTGEVYRPGSYKIEPETSVEKTESDPRTRQPPRLSQALQVAGGIKPLANIRSIEVRRFNHNGSQQTIIVDLWELLQDGNINQDIILQDGDTILIPTAEKLDPQEAETFASASFAPESIRVNVVGEVKKPGAVELPPNTPLNQAILAAGGFDKRRAKQGTVQLIRLNPNGTVSKRKISVDFSKDIDDESNPPMRNNDVVVINRNAITATSDTLVNVLRPVGALVGLSNLIEIFN